MYTSSSGTWPVVYNAGLSETKQKICNRPNNFYIQIFNLHTNHVTQKSEIKYNIKEKYHTIILLLPWDFKLGSLITADNPSRDNL